MLKRPLLGVGVVLVLLVGAVLIPIVGDRLERNAAIARLGSAVANTPDGGTVDLAQALDMDWDRLVIVGPYRPPSPANALLGFQAYGDGETLTVSDEDQWVAFALGGRVVADFRIPSAEAPFSFADQDVSLTPDNARFRVQREGEIAVLSK